MTMYLYINGQKINFTNLQWSGSKYNAARQIVAGYPSDLAYKFKQGNTVIVKEDKKEIFKGHVFRVDKSYKSNEITVTAYNPMIYFLNSSGVFNVKSTTVGAYIRKIASNVGVPVGSLADSSKTIKLEPQLSGINLYEAIMEGYREVKKQTKKNYIPTIEKGKLVIDTAGEVVKDLELRNEINLLDTTYSETIENVINKVLIVDDKGKKIGQVTGSGLNDWGIFQDVYSKEDGKNPTTEAKKLLHGLDREVTVEALGDIRCISGKAVRVKDLDTGINGLFYIDEDTHTWSGNNHTMSLTLNYKNEMEEGL